MDFVAFNVILDDVALPDGLVERDLLGGGGPQTAWGMRLWADSAGLVGAVGEDFPASARQWLERCGIDGGGLREVHYPSLRARQEVQADGSNRHVWQASPDAMRAMLERKVEYLPSDYQKARGFHFGLHPLEAQRAFQDGLRALGGLVSVEMFRPAERTLNDDELCELMGAADIFSLNIYEARSLLGGEGSPLELARVLLQRMPVAGAGIISLRLGAQGSLVVRRGVDQAARIPAIDVPVVDPVGAGNAYCGAFVAGWAQSGDLAEAGLMGAVAASFMVEQSGCPPTLDEGTRAEAKRRLERARVEVEWITQ
jgi:sugar/nucleoside kinase (ribokinase family)